ncbi:short-chain dehydrogenase [Xanthomonas arboricola pv. juglandis]|jgi:NAD(P)-dependent dehydrogenase (short-subunit alcohol dehydrogenase family)|uniref:SDR family oxidoreductase n=1 Tax=Xanthomonas euroxanthea TaxID=2259622 RepID=A0A6V7MDM1_9XANT|nr:MULTISPECIES: SDR family oxidoreductase [Xanthomonas]RYE93418.1 MAG: SDR family oxidoreductase [Oxalobacteraceae bacterium]SYZ49832.1 short-chain dehydrogenase [Xanthomonas arboricola pv. juglandis]KER88303.1 short-chain dehydrogenase [Xanthomonas arboricola pv. celebensis]MBB4606223.1 NAD(P)-dependent dehydrogenase (short-subunit alcohol dehydrogenase family) [Xanthomonas arboricola]MCC8671295.1 SDR family oxidoreductase [Xanthomonas arboricola]
MSRLAGKRTLITGGTTGIGLETAKQFLAEGARVIVTGVNPDSIAKAQAILGPDVPVLRADSASVAAQQELAQAVQAHYGQLDVVFLNAGVSVWVPIEEWTEQAFDASFAINVKGPYFLLQALLPVLANPASVVLNTSVNVHAGMARSSVYAATKAAFLSMTKTLSSELLGRGIRVNAVSPGPVETPLYDKLGVPDAYRAKLNEEIAASIPMGRFGTPEEVAKAVLYLASDESSWTVGSEIVVDGGRLLNG